MTASVNLGLSGKWLDARLPLLAIPVIGDLLAIKTIYDANAQHTAKTLVHPQPLKIDITKHQIASFVQVAVAQFFLAAFCPPAFVTLLTIKIIVSIAQLYTVKRCTDTLPAWVPDRFR